MIISRSNVVGKPLALLLLQKHATVKICHSRTTNLAALARQPGMVTAEMVKPGAAVIEVGINALPDGRIVGDLMLPPCVKWPGRAHLYQAASGHSPM